MKYTFAHEESLIKELEIFEPFKGQHRALVNVPESATSEQLEGFKEAMRKNGYTMYADSENGKHVLALENFGSPEALLANMDNDKVVFGNYASVATPLDKEDPKQTLGQWYQDNQLSISGVIYGIADALGIASGLMRNNMAMVGMGAAWMMPSVGLYFGGKQSTEMHMGFAFRDFEKMLDENNISVSSDVQTLFEKDRSNDNLLEAAKEWNALNSTDFNAGCQATGGALGALGGWQEKNPYHIYSGAAVIVGMGGSLLLQKEKEKIPAATNLGIDLSDASAVAAAQEQSQATGTEPPKAEFSPAMDSNDNDYHLNERPEVPFSQKWAGGWAFTNNIAKLISGPLFERPQLEKFNREFMNNYTEHHDALASLQSELQAAKDAVPDINQAVHDLGANRKMSDLPDAVLDDYNAKLEAFQDVDAKAKSHHEALAELSDTKHNKQMQADASLLDQTAQLFYLAANYIYGTSPKEHLPEIDVKKMVAVAANIVIIHPKEDRSDLANQMGTMMSNLKQIEYSAGDMSTLIEQKANALINNPFLNPAMRIEVSPDAVCPTPTSDEILAAQRIADNSDRPESIVKADPQSVERVFDDQRQHHGSNDDQPTRADNYIQRLEAETAINTVPALH